MKKSDYFIRSLLHAAGVFIYVFLVASIMFNNKAIFGEEVGILVPLFMLLLFVVSASITGLLVLGKPIFLYINGFKKEALILLFATLAWLVVFLVGVMSIFLLS
ncbi:hypothetical protein HY967_03495 [Candidatus Jorgensenbacteria bacterium]|nr:hypothetical protein [Candidatus Jorgensenbacteria bacterium]